MKILKIESCKECPFKIIDNVFVQIIDYSADDLWYCTFKSRTIGGDVEIIDDKTNDFPGMCPLGDGDEV